MHYIFTLYCSRVGSNVLKTSLGLPDSVTGESTFDSIWVADTLEILVEGFVECLGRSRPSTVTFGCRFPNSRGTTVPSLLVDRRLRFGGAFLSMLSTFGISSFGGSSSSSSTRISAMLAYGLKPCETRSTCWAAHLKSSMDLA